MGGFAPQIQQPQSPPSGKGTGISATPQQADDQKKLDSLFTGLAGGKVTYPGQQGQPEMGMPNQYSNTVGLGDNQQQLLQPQAGKGKGV